MKLNEIARPEGNKKAKPRKGRGPGTGNGKTAGRGHKGQMARSGAKHRAWFEGGQMPIQRRVPKRGFTNIFRKGTETVNVGELSQFGDGATVDAASLAERGLIRGSGDAVKLLGEGDAPNNLTVKLNRVSASARAKIESAGGTVELI
jgi:large subunit ribosomal protein L15